MALNWTYHTPWGDGHKIEANRIGDAQWHLQFERGAPKEIPERTGPPRPWRYASRWALLHYWENLPLDDKVKMQNKRRQLVSNATEVIDV